MLAMAIAVSCFLMAGPALARTSDELKALQQEIQTLQQGQANIQKDLDEIRPDMVEGQKLGISGTPSFVVGLTDPEDPSKVHLTKFIRGAQSLTAFSAAIDELIKTAAAKK